MTRVTTPALPREPSPKAPLRLALISSIAGQDIRQCTENLIDRSAGAAFALRRGEQILTVEDFLVDGAAEHLARYFKRTTGFTLASVLLLPQAELAHACQKAFSAAVDALVAQSSIATTPVIGVLPFHPVLYHQLTREFIHPYQAESIRTAIQRADVQLTMILSIHDDVYDTYRNLLGSNKLFAPLTTRTRVLVDGQPTCLREPFRDIHEQLLLLNWRSAELTEAKALAAGCGTRHFLFHQKGSADALWRVVGRREMSVYFSHPISQPRRDTTSKADPTKSSEADPRRGEALIKKCQDACAKLKRQFAVVEPTAIDELRIDYDWLKDATDKDLAGAVLPPVTRRWPLSDGPHLGGPPNSDSARVLSVPSSVYERVKFDGKTLSGLESALKILAEEIRRQINVRDHSLAEQCDIVVAYRPFSLPNSPEPTGGVKKEIEMVITKVALGKVACKPALYIIHPYEDESRRRHNEFERLWPRLAVKWLADSEQREVENLKLAIERRVLDAPYIPDVHALYEAILPLLREEGVAISPVVDNSSMNSDAFARTEAARRTFVKELLEDTVILRSELHRNADDGDLKGFVMFIDEETITRHTLDEISHRAPVRNENGKEDLT